MEFRNSKQNFAMIASKFIMATWYTDRLRTGYFFIPWAPFYSYFGCSASHAPPLHLSPNLVPRSVPYIRAPKILGQEKVPQSSWFFWFSKWWQTFHHTFGEVLHHVKAKIIPVSNRNLWITILRCHRIA